MKNIFPAIAALIGTIIGAGILGIPYVIVKSGFTIGLIHLIAISILIMVTMLYLGEIALRTKANHHLVGYAEKYLGKKGRILMFLAVTFGVYAAILAYLIGAGESLSFLFLGTAAYKLQFGIATWFLMSFIVYFEIKALKEGESIGIIIIFILIVSIVILFWNKINPANLEYINLSNVFLPFGVILFAFLGFTAIPEVEIILKHQKNKMKKSIITAILISLVIYIIFAIIVVGSQGTNTPQIATLSLGKPFILLGIITMLTSYLALSIALINTIKFDFKKSKKKAWLYTISIPIILYLILEFFQSAEFTKVLGMGGVLAGGLMAILILSMVKKAKEKSEVNPPYSIPYSAILKWILIAIFIIGAILEIMNTI